MTTTLKKGRATHGAPAMTRSVVEPRATSAAYVLPSPERARRQSTTSIQGREDDRALRQAALERIDDGKRRYRRILYWREGVTTIRYVFRMAWRALLLSENAECLRRARCWRRAADASRRTPFFRVSYRRS